jgi:hypothetical protein
MTELTSHMYVYELKFTFLGFQFGLHRWVKQYVEIGLVTISVRFSNVVAIAAFSLQEVEHCSVTVTADQHEINLDTN